MSESEATHHHDPSDVKLDRFTRRNAPVTHGAFMALHNGVFRADSPIPRKYLELMALSVALTTQCAWCIEHHTRGAKQYEATAEEVAETIMLAGLLRASGAVAHGRLVWRSFNED